MENESISDNPCATAYNEGFLCSAFFYEIDGNVKVLVDVPKVFMIQRYSVHFIHIYHLNIVMVLATKLSRAFCWQELATTEHDSIVHTYFSIYPTTIAVSKQYTTTNRGQGEPQPTHMDSCAGTS
jgi:hypothetical protein